MIAIRAEMPDDHEAIRDLTRLAFGGDDEARLIDRIRGWDGFDSSLSRVATAGSTVVGHILFSPIHIEAGADVIPALALAPMAVRPDHQRQGIGSALVRDGLDACRRRGHRIVVVVGHPGFYPRFGFRPASRFGVRPPFAVPDEAFMALALVSDGRIPRGTVRYSAAFQMNDLQPGE